MLPPVPPAGVFDVRVLLNGAGVLTVPATDDEAVYPLQRAGGYRSVQRMLLLK